MTRLPDLEVDLAAPPQRRWRFADGHADAARDLLRIYNTDLGVDGAAMRQVAALAPDVVPAELLQEMAGVAALLGATPEAVLLANLHYDLLKVVLGCTAFAVDAPGGPLHARNLDWWTTARALNDGTVVTRFVNGPAGDFVTVGWPALVGAFSGVAAGRFAVTLNAVLGDEPGQVALPVVMLVRQVLQQAHGYAEAVAALSATTIASDCLLLVTGVEPGQRVVIERTPTRCAHRTATAGEPLRVTNDYLALDVGAGGGDNELLRTSCGRYDRIGELLAADPPGDLARCLDLLGDDGVRMDITVQQMAFRARTGDCVVRVP